MASSITLSLSDPKAKYRLTMKLVKITPHPGGSTNPNKKSRESIWCGKEIDLTNISEEAFEMSQKLALKIKHAVVK